MFFWEFFPYALKEDLYLAVLLNRFPVQNR
jgi:hypothetical protein